MRDIAYTVQRNLPDGVGFALLVYENNAPGLSNYISTSDCKDMIKALRECADKLEKGDTFPTPEHQ